MWHSLELLLHVFFGGFQLVADSQARSFALTKSGPILAAKTPFLLLYPILCRWISGFPKP